VHRASQRHIMMEWLLYLVLGIAGITAGAFARRLPPSGRAAVACLAGPVSGYYFAWLFC